MYYQNLSKHSLKFIKETFSLQNHFLILSNRNLNYYKQYETRDYNKKNKTKGQFKNYCDTDEFTNYLPNLKKN